MKIMIIANFVTLTWEKGNSRFMYLANELSKNSNLEVEIVTSNFNHGTKQKKYIDQKEINKLNYKFTFLDEPGYNKNVSLRRFYSHWRLSKNLKKYLKNLQEKPDIIYCAVPSLDFAKEVAKYAKKNYIRFIIDIQDLWPEAFKMVFKIPLLSNAIFYPMKRQANYIYKCADDIIAVSDTYRDRAASVNKKYKNKLTVFLGTNLDYFDQCKEENIKHYNDNIIRIAYIGTLGHSYNIKIVIDALELLKEKYNNLNFIVMGSGPLKKQFEDYAKDKDINCEFTGRLEYPEMVGTLCSCDIAVNPITHGAAQSIINKVGDYAAAGLPVINTQENLEYRNLVEKYNIGYNCENSNKQDIANKIEILIKDKKLRKELGNNNRKLAEEKFDRRITYTKICDLLEKKNNAKK